MKPLSVASLESFFILGFGVVHLVIPFLLPPNFVAETTILGGLRIADFVLPGCFAVAISAILYYVTKNILPAALLAFLYGGGIVFHALYLSGIFPSVLIVPTQLVPAGGIIIDAISIGAIFDYYRRIRKRI